MLTGMQRISSVCVAFLEQRGRVTIFLDKEQMSFVYYTAQKRWLVVGGGKQHGKIVALPSNPHKRVVHSHFARCVVKSPLLVWTWMKFKMMLKEKGLKILHPI